MYYYTLVMIIILFGEKICYNVVVVLVRPGQICLDGKEFKN